MSVSEMTPRSTLSLQLVKTSLFLYNILSRSPKDTFSFTNQIIWPFMGCFMEILTEMQTQTLIRVFFIKVYFHLQNLGQ